MVGICSYGGYIPRYRLSRMTIVQNMAWYFPVIMAVSSGEKSVANWDEDALSMAVAASYDCMTGKARQNLGGVYLASTTMPFADRLNAGILSTALNAPEHDVLNADFSACLKSGTTATIAALEAVKSGERDNILVAASDLRNTKAATMYEMFLGDGAAALLIGSRDVIAEFKGSYSINCDFVDHYRARDKNFDYAWEERWVRDEGYGKIIPEAISGYLKKSGMAITDFAKIIYPCYFTGTHRDIAKKLGIDPSKAQDNMHNVCGDTGSAHPLLMLIGALEKAQPGDKLLMCSFGQGCDVLCFEATEKLASFKGPKGVSGSLSNREPLTNYQKYTKFRDLIVADLGIRGEANPNTSLTALWRARNMILGVKGVKCKKCGTVQFPPTAMCVNPECNAIREFVDHEFADKEAEVLMFTGDMLSPSVDPPAVYGLVAMEGGGRILVDFTDCDLNKVKVGQKASLSFRKRQTDDMRGFTGYFWKAIPHTEGGV